MAQVIGYAFGFLAGLLDLDFGGLALLHKSEEIGGSQIISVRLGPHKLLDKIGQEDFAIGIAVEIVRPAPILRDAFYELFSLGFFGTFFCFIDGFFESARSD